MVIEPWMYWAGGLLLLLIILYNRMIFLRNKVNETFKNIDIYLEQRFDTLTKMAETVASYTDHEQETFMKVTKLREGFSDLSNNEKVKRSNEASKMTGGLNVENYPELNASKNFLHLQESINELEGYLSAAKRSYNARVNQYNTWTQSFPLILFARIAGFGKRELLEIEERKKQDLDMRSMLRG